MTVAEPGRRLADAEPQMSLTAATIAVSEMTGVSLDRLRTFILIAAAEPLPEDRPHGRTEIMICSPASLDQQITVLEMTLADLRAARDGC
jgi:hypothetical protein